MQHSTLRRFTLLFSLTLLAGLAGGCKKQVAATPPSAPPAPTPQPTVTLGASPRSIAPGGTVTLSWTSTNATDLEISPEVGRVPPQGSTPVSPDQSTTYTITATGTGGSA